MQLQDNWKQGTKVLFLTRKAAECEHGS
jgi:hypothetical protein